MARAQHVYKEKGITTKEGDMPERANAMNRLQLFMVAGQNNKRMF